MSIVLRHHFEAHDPRLGRHIAHDERSHEFPAMRADAIKTIRHVRHVPIFDQGNIGSCTGNAEAGCLSTGPFTNRFTEADAVSIYSQATHLDSIRGAYPPMDTGSSGLAVMKAAKRRGLISSYHHAFGLDHVLHALTLMPGITGISWVDGCDDPDSHGVVRYRGATRGGHEIEIVGVDAEAKLVWFANSWGPGWGKDGCFAMSWEDYGKALANYGDATFPVI